MGIVVPTPEGDEYVAFRDPVLEKLVGETITVVDGDSFIMRRWKVQRAR